METTVRTWHYGMMAKHWSEHNTTGPEIAYFQQKIEQYGQPALDAGCGTGRLLIPYLRAGLDVDGSDVSGDMLAYCRSTAEAEGLSPRLYRQALHELDLPRRYRTIVACGVFGIGVSRAQDFHALQQFYQYLEPGGVLLLEHYLPYGDANIWPLWSKKARTYLPPPWPENVLDPPADSSETAMHYRLVAVDPLEQQTTGEMRLLEFRAGEVVSDATYPLTENRYFRNELRGLVERAGFTVEAEENGWDGASATAESAVIVYVARK